MGHVALGPYLPPSLALVFFFKQGGGGLRLPLGLPRPPTTPLPLKKNHRTREEGHVYFFFYKGGSATAPSWTPALPLGLPRPPVTPPSSKKNNRTREAWGT